MAVGEHIPLRYSLVPFERRLAPLKKARTYDEHSLGAGEALAGSGRDAKHPAAFSFGKRALSRREAHLQRENSLGRLVLTILRVVYRNIWKMSKQICQRIS